MEANEDLTEEQRDKLLHFREFTHIDSVETCRQFLANHNWNVEQAIETALISGAGVVERNESIDDVDEDIDPPVAMRVDHPAFLPPAPPPLPANMMPSARGLPPGGRQVNHRAPSPAAARFLPRSVRELFRTPLTFLYAIYLKLQPFLPWTIIRFVCSFVRTLFIGDTPRDPIHEVDAYCTYFNQHYGTHHPAFYRGKFTQALQDAQREVRLLFIYLHEKNSPLCDRFCREVLCEDALASQIGNNLLWSVNRESAEGASVCRLLHATRFPCFCVMAHQGSSQTIQLKLDRYSDASECLAEIMTAIMLADQTLQANRVRRNTQTARTEEINRQNEEFEAAKLVDQEKAKRRQEEDAQRRKEELERERIHDEQQRKLKEFADFRASLREKQTAEPNATESNIIQISIRLPRNEPLRRRFRRTDPVKELFEFAWTCEHVPDSFELLWGYPRKRYQYSQLENEQTIGEVMSGGSSETCYLEESDES